MAKKKNRIIEIEKEISKAKKKVLAAPIADNTPVNKELLRGVVQTLKDEYKQLATLENNQNANINKALGTYDKTIDAINKLLEKDTVTNEERKFYVLVAEKYMNDIKEIILLDVKSKQEDKKPHRDFIMVGVTALSVSAVIALAGNITLKIINSLKK